MDTNFRERNNCGSYGFLHMEDKRATIVFPGHNYKTFELDSEEGGKAQFIPQDHPLMAAHAIFYRDPETNKVYAFQNLRHKSKTSIGHENYYLDKVDLNRPITPPALNRSISKAEDEMTIEFKTASSFKNYGNFILNKFAPFMMTPLHKLDKHYETQILFVDFET